MNREPEDLNALLGALFDQAPDPATVSRLADGTLLMVNEAWCHLTGVDAAEALGRTPGELGLWTSASDRGAYLGELGRNGQLQPRRVALLSRDGHLHMMLLTAKVLAFGQEAVALVSGKELTSARELDPALREPEVLAAKALREAVRSRTTESLGLLAGNVAEAFGSHLQALAGLLEAAQRGLPADSAALEPLRAARTPLQRAQALAAQLNAVTGLAPGRPSPLDLAAHLGALEPALARQAGPALSVVLTLEAVPPVLADPEQLAEALFALCANAREAAEETTGQLGIHLLTLEALDRRCGEGEWILPRPAGPRTVCIEVADDGPGVPPDQQARMFDPFWTTRGPGRGLGLARVLGVLKGHRAGLQTASVPGQGLMHRLHLPPAEGLS